VLEVETQQNPNYYVKIINHSSAGVPQIIDVSPSGEAGQVSPSGDVGESATIITGSETTVKTDNAGNTVRTSTDKTYLSTSVTIISTVSQITASYP
jgi:hypothetical protein